MKHKYVLFTLFFMLVTSGTLFAHNDPADAPPLAILKNVLNLSEEQVGEIGVWWKLASRQFGHWLSRSRFSSKH